MVIKVTCACGRSFGAQPELAGRRVACPACGGPLTIPQTARGPAPRAGSTLQFAGEGRPTTPADPAAGPVVACRCGARFRAKLELVGKTVACPSCRQPLRIPSATAARPTLPPSPTGLQPGDDAGLPWEDLARFEAASPLSSSRPLTPSRAVVRSGPIVDPKLAAWIGGGIAGVVLLLVLGTFAWRAVAPFVRDLPFPRSMADAESIAEGEAASGAARPARSSGFSLFGTRWEEYRLSGGSFVAQFPGTPRTRRETIPTPAGPCTTVIAELRTRQGEFGVMTGTYAIGPQVTFDGQMALDGAVEGLRRSALAQFGGRVVSVQPVTLNGHAGREIDVEGTVGGRAMKGRFRIYLRGAELLQILWAGPADQLDAEDVAKFFDSFQITEGPSSPAGEAA